MTWSTLSNRAGGQQPLVSYEITEQDVAGPFAETIPRDLMQQSKLDALNFTSPLEMLAEKFHVPVLTFIDTMGVASFVAECDRLADRYGERFRPSAWLRARAAEARAFHRRIVA